MNSDTLRQGPGCCVEPAFGGEKIVNELLLVHVFVEVEWLFNQISYGPEQEETGLKKLRQAIAEGINECPHRNIPDATKCQAGCRGW